MPIWLVVLFILSIVLFWGTYLMYYFSNVVRINLWIVIGLPILTLLIVLWTVFACNLPKEIDHTVIHPIHTATGNSDKMYSYITTETEGDIIVTGIENRVYPEGKFIHKRIVYKQWYVGIYFAIPDKILIVQK